MHTIHGHCCDYDITALRRWRTRANNIIESVQNLDVDTIRRNFVGAKHSRANPTSGAFTSSPPTPSPMTTTTTIRFFIGQYHVDAITENMQRQLHLYLLHTGFIVARQTADACGHVICVRTFVARVATTDARGTHRSMYVRTPDREAR